MDSPRRALLSVSDKTGLVDLAGRLVSMGWELLASGGTGKALADAGLPFVPVEQVTRNAEAFDGRMKTISFEIESAILYDRQNPSHVEQARALGIVPIDMVVCNFYPFVPGRADVELIDVGGPTMVRAAAKNFASVVVVVDPTDYGLVLAEMQGVTSGMPSLACRQELAAKAFSRLSGYDGEIACTLGRKGVTQLTMYEHRPLRYGENPHQEGRYFSVPGDDVPLALPKFLALRDLFDLPEHKPLSYNNILDADAVLNCLSLLGGDVPAACIVKHTNPCGAARAEDIGEAFERAWAGDSTAAFGGIAAVNRTVDGPTLERMLNNRFLEVFLAPELEKAAIEFLLNKKRNLRVLLNPGLTNPSSAKGWEYRSIRGGMLAQERDSLDLDPASLTCPTKAQPTEAQRADLLLAWQICRASRSNAITLVRDQRLVGNGVGQQDRVGACRIAVERAGDRAQGAVAASDAFFPFPDGPEVLAKAGVVAIIQPGGSVRDQETIDACDRHGVAMLLTGGVRCFKH